MKRLNYTLQFNNRSRRIVAILGILGIFLAVLATKETIAKEILSKAAMRFKENLPVSSPEPRESPRIVATLTPGELASLGIREGNLVKSPDGPQVYRILNGKRKHIPSPELFLSYGLRWEDIKTLELKTLVFIPEIKLIQAPGDPVIYYIDNLQKRPLKNNEVIASYDLAPSDVLTVDKRELDAYPLARLFRLPGEEKIYYITDSGFRRHIPNPTTFVSYGFTWWNVIYPTHEDLMTYPLHTLVTLEGSRDVYFLQPGNPTTRHWLETPQTVNLLGQGSWGEIASVNAIEFYSYPLGTALKEEDIDSEEHTPVSEREDTRFSRVSAGEKQNILTALKNGTANVSGDILLRDRSDYRIVFSDSEFSPERFLISVLKSDFETTRIAAENDLVSLLGISRQNACKLTIVSTTPRYVNPSRAGNQYPLSSCP